MYKLLFVGLPCVTKSADELLQWVAQKGYRVQGNMGKLDIYEGDMLICTAVRGCC